MTSAKHNNPVHWYLRHDEDVDDKLEKYLLTRNDVHVHKEAPPVAYGSHGVGRSTFNHSNEFGGLEPGLFFDCPQSFWVSDWGPKFAKHWINAGGLFTNQRNFEHQFSNFPDREVEFFVRPDRGFKSFPSGVYKLKDIPALIQDCGYEDWIYVAKKKTILAEFRWLAVGNKLITGCCYANQSNCWYHPERVEAKAQDILSECYTYDCFLEHSPYIIDFCLAVNPNNYLEHELKMLELNAFGFSGLYDMELSKVVDTVNDCYRYAVEEWNK